MSHHTIPRRPSPEELQQLSDFVAERYEYMPTSEEYEEARNFAEQAHIAVIDQFQSDRPGYAGKLMLVVWNMGPECYETFCWRDGLLEIVPQDSNFGLV